MKLLKAYINNKMVFYYKKNDKYIGEVVANTGKYESFESKTILNHINEGDQVGDIGANIGYYSLIMSKKVGPKGMVYAFEPDPESFYILKKNIIANNAFNIKAYSTALSFKKADKLLFLSKSNFGDHRMFEDKNEKYTRHSIKIKTDSLDNILFNEKTYHKIKLLKIDTQGYEPLVIKGATGIIKKDKPLLFMEYWPYGYKCIKTSGKKMIDFLKKRYGVMYMVDNRYGALYRADYNYIKNYCQQSNGLFFCDLLFKKESYPTRIKQAIISKIKEYENFPYRLGKPINFGIKGNAYFYQKRGWSYPENNFTWTNGKFSSLYIPFKKSSKDMKLYLLIKPLIFKKLMYQRLIIQLNNKKVFDKEISNPNYLDYKIDILKKSNKDGLTIKIHIPTAVSPYKIGMNEDKRVLGIAVKKIKIV